jgi:prolipoprotein diacylglyceryltransferase
MRGTSFDSFLPIRLLKDHPVLYSGKHVNIVYFGVFGAINCIAILTFFMYYLFIKGIAITPQFLYLLPLGGIMVWMGARAMHLISLGKKVFQHPQKYLFETGFYFQGGIIGAILWSIVLASATQIPLSIVWDGLCLGTLLGQVFGRVGCFNYGCCYGKPTKAKWGVTYTNMASKVLRLHPHLKGVSIHPAQLYKACLNLLFFGIAMLLIPLVPPNGTFTLGFLIYHGLSRIGLEYFRADIYFNHKRNWITYYLSLGFISAAIILWILGPWIDQVFFSRWSLVESHSLQTLGKLMLHEPFLFLVILFIGGLTFLGYGIHGKTLGRFPIPAQAKKKIEATKSLNTSDVAERSFYEN